jgi:tyrosyl-tRNA synthetase
MKAINVNKLTGAGCTFKFWVADWFAQLNNKMGGDLKKIQTVGRYMVEVRHVHFIYIYIYSLI